MNKILKNCLVLNDDLSLEKKDIYISDDRFADFVEGEVEDMHSALVLPGLVNTHTHAAMTLFRGIAEDVELYEWLSTYIFPREAKLTEEDVYIGSLVGFMEMIKNGTTTFVDMYFFQDAVAQAAKDVGMRGIIARGLADVDGHGDEKLRECEDFILKHSNDPLIKGGVGPHALYTCSNAYFEKSVNLAHSTNSVLTYHLLESPFEREDYRKRTSVESVDFLDSIGAFDERTIIAHGTHLNKKELDLLSRRKTTLSYNPISNAKLGNGVAPIPVAFSKGVNVALGTDSAASNNSLNLFDEMKFGSLIQRAHEENPTLMKMEEIFKMATSNAQKPLPFDVGKIKSGMLADIVVVDTKRLSLMPKKYMKSHLIYSFNTSSIEKVMVGGKWIYNREFTNMDSCEVMERFEKTVASIDSRL